MRVANHGPPVDWRFAAAVILVLMWSLLVLSGQL